ncbi:MAG: hypothetical protein ACOY4I_08195 [Bacillota bacterium]
MVVRKQTAQEAAPLLNNDIEVVAGRVKKDLVWVLAGIVISLGVGLAVGNLFKF